MSGMGGFTSDTMGGGFMADDGNKGKGSEKKVKYFIEKYLF